MNEFQLPPHQRLPDDVRERALQKVLDGIAVETGAPDAEPPRVPSSRRGWWLAVAAAVAVVVALVGVALAVGPTGQGTSRSASFTGRPIGSGDPIVDLALARCAAAVTAQDRAAEYPPITTWRATATLYRSSENVGTPAQPDIAIAVSDAFVCFAGASEVVVSATHGTQAGDVQLTKLGPTVLLVVLNPQRRTVTFDPDSSYGGYVPAAPPTAPVQLVPVQGAATSIRLTVAGSFDGPLPEPAAGGILANDRPSISRAPVPPGSGSLDDCLSGALPGEPVALRHDGPPAAVAAVRRDGAYAGFCATGQRGSSFQGGGLPPLAGRAQATVVAQIGGVEPDIVAVLLAVPADTRSVGIAPAPRDGTTGPAPTACTTRGGLALCTLAAPGPVRVVVTHADGTTTVVPLE